MINNLFDKKTTEYEFLSVSDQLPFKSSEIEKELNSFQINAQGINSIFNHLIDNDLYNEQLILNLSANRNVAGASVTGISNDIILYSQDGQKYVLTSNSSPEVQIVKRIVSDANSDVEEATELKGRRINFIIDDSQKYVVGTDIGLFCSEDRLSGWHPVGDNDYFREPYRNYDCRCIIKNYFQGQFHNDLDRFQYFLGTNRGVFGLDNSDYFNDFVFWDKLGPVQDNPIDDVKVNSLKLDSIERCLFVGTDTGIWNVHGDNSGNLMVSLEKYSNYFKTNDIEILEDGNLRNKNEHILVGSNSGIRQSTQRFFPNNLTRIHDFVEENITVLGIDGVLKYVGTDKGLYKFNGRLIPDTLTGNINAIEFLHIGNLTYQFVVSDKKVYCKLENETVWNPFGPFQSLTDVIGLTAIDDRLLMAVVENPNNYGGRQVVYTQWIVNAFRKGGRIALPLSAATKINDVGSDDLVGYVGTNAGINVYQFANENETSAFFKVQNNLKDKRIVNIIDVTYSGITNIFIETIENTQSGLKYGLYVSTDSRKFDDYTFKGYFDEEIISISRNSNDYFFSTKTKTYKNDNTQLVKCIVNGVEKDVSSFLVIDNRVFFVSAGNVYCVFLYNFNTLIQENHLSNVLENINNGRLLNVDGTESVLIDFMAYKEDSLELSQYVVYEKDEKILADYAISNDLNGISVEYLLTHSIDPSTSQEEIEVNTEPKELSTINLQKALIYCPENPDNDLYYISENTFYRSFINNTPDKEERCLNAMGTAESFMFSYPFIDMKYLDKVLYVGDSKVYGAVDPYNLKTTYADTDGEIQPYGTLYPFNDSDSSYKLYDADNESEKIFIFSKTDNSILGYKVGFHEVPLNDYAYDNFVNKLVNDLSVFNGTVNHVIYDNRFNSLNNIYFTSEGIYEYAENRLGDNVYFGGIKKTSNQSLKHASQKYLTKTNIHAGDSEIFSFEAVADTDGFIVFDMPETDSLSSTLSIYDNNYFNASMNISAESLDLGSAFQLSVLKYFNGDTKLSASDDLLINLSTYIVQTNDDNISMRITDISIMNDNGRLPMTMMEKVIDSRDEKAELSMMVDDEIYASIAIFNNTDYMAIGGTGDKLFHSTNLDDWTQLGYDGSFDEIMELTSNTNIENKFSMVESIDAILANGNCFLKANDLIFILLNDEMVNVDSFEQTQGNVKTMLVMADGKMIIASYAEDQTSFSILSDISRTNSGISITLTPHSKTVDFEITKMVLDERNKNIFILGTSNTKWFKYNNIDESWEEQELKYEGRDIWFNNVLIDKSLGTTYAYGITDGKGNIFKLYDNSSFKKIMVINNASDSNIILKDVCNTSFKDYDIFYEKELFTYDHRAPYMMGFGVHSDNQLSFSTTTTPKKVACYSFDGNKKHFVAIYDSGSMILKTVPYDVSNNTVTTLSNLASCYPGKTLVDLTIQEMENDGYVYIIALLHDSSGYSMNRMHVYVNGNEIVVDKNTDDCDGNFISSIDLPEGITSLNSFATYKTNSSYDEGLNSRTIYFSTNKGLAYLKKMTDSSTGRVFKLIPTDKTPKTNIPNKPYFEEGNYIFTCDDSGYLERIDKLTLSSKTVQLSNITGLLGISGVDNSLVYGRNSTGVAMKPDKLLNWDDTTNKPSFSTIDFINGISSSSMYIGNDMKNTFFGSLGIYGLQNYTPLSGSSYNIYPRFEIDCVEFDNGNPIFSMHMLCIALEFDYISSSYDYLTMETMNRVQAIDKISDNEIAIVDNESIKIYRTDISQLIDLDLFDFKMELDDELNAMIESLSPVGSDRYGNLYLAVNNDIFMSFNSYGLKRVFGDTVGNYKILQKKIRDGKYNVNNICLLNDTNMFIATNPTNENGKPYAFHYIKDLRMDVSLTDENGSRISSDSRAIASVISDISNGYKTKYLFSSGNKLYDTLNKINAEVEVDKIPSEKTITSLFAENDATYMIGTTNGLYVTTPTYKLDNEMTRWNVESVSELMQDMLSIEIDRHINTFHDGNNLQSRFLSVLNTKMPVAPQKTPEWFTTRTDSIAYDSIEYVLSDVVESMEFNDSNKYIRGSVRNWVTEFYGGDSTYSDNGYVDQITDPLDKNLIDFSDVQYVCKNWNSGMKEILVHVPTTMTYYINNPKGFSNGKFSGSSIPRKNVNNTTTTNVISDKCTHYQLILDNRHFEIKEIIMVQINGNSLPLRIYRDDTYCQEGRENLFDTVMQPSELNSLPVIPNEDVNNITYMTDSSGYLRINFSIYGTDEQSIRILAK